MKKRLEIWVMVFKVSEVKTGRSLTMDDIVDIETRNPIMIGRFVPVGRVEESRTRRHVKRAGAARHAHRRTARKR